MTNKQRVINSVTGREYDHVPFIMPFGPWVETLKRWQEEGMPTDKTFWEVAECDPGFVNVPGVIYGYHPAFEYKVLEQKEDKAIIIDWFGIKSEISTTHSTIPRYLEFPVKDRDSWKALKERLDISSPGRLDMDRIKNYNNNEGIITLGAYPYGLFGTLRDMMGIEGLMFSLYDEPELVQEIMDYLTDLWINIYSQVCAHVKVDCIHMWEDMSGKQGPLISPSMIKEFMAPNYKKIKQFCINNDIPVFSLDTDGKCDEMFDIWIDCGINLVYPFEVAAGNNVVDIKSRYPSEFCVLGGIDKREIAKGKYYIDKELERIAPALYNGYYIPALDHLFPPDISYENFLYFAKKLKELTCNFK